MEEEIQEQVESTENIIQTYLQRFQQPEIQIGNQFPQEITELSIIPNFSNN